MQLPSKTLVIATRNPGKVKEFAHYFEDRGLSVRSLADYPDLPDVEEDGTTFAENALKKAKTIARLLEAPVLADDSGLCVDALGGEPGVYSARYAGEPSNDAANNAKLLRELQARSAEASVPAVAAAGAELHPPVFSAARFVCALALYDPAAEEELVVEGECPGYILREARGNGGFGYDPLFYLPVRRQTMAELDMDAKNRISHRAAALQRLLRLLG